MENIHVIEFLKEITPTHFKDICGAVDLLSEELEHTKAALSKDLIAAQSGDDYALAREILDVQEKLSHCILSIRKFLEENDPEDFREGVDERTDEPELVQAEINHPDYSQYDTDDTIAYDIENTLVTYKRPAAFSLNGKRYAATNWKTLYSNLCGLLYKINPAILSDILNGVNMSGKNKVRMSLNKEEIRNPAKIAGSDIWLETNKSAANIRSSILYLLGRYGIPANRVKVYFRRDYASLHEDDGTEDSGQ